MNPDEPSTSSESKPRKRTHSNIELEVESEQTKQQEHVPIQEKKAKERQATNILDCPDILLFRIFQHVDKEDLRNLSLCCTKFSRIALHEVFWTYDYTNKPILPSQMEPYENFLEPLTHTLKIRGDFKQKTENILERSFFFQVKQICQILHTLKLRNYLINLDEVTPEMSTNIVRLLFSNCIASSSIGLVFNTTYFFRGICRFVPHVQSLYFFNVLWNMSYSTFLSSISNLTDLLHLFVRSCFRIQEFNSDIDLVTVTCKCHKLKILNFTDTLVEHRVVEWFCQIESLEEVYLHCPKYFRKKCPYKSLYYSKKSLAQLQNFYYKEYISLRAFDEKLYNFLCKVESLLDANKFEEILMYRNNQFQNYLLSNISRCISRCTNLKKLHIRHYSHVTRTDINIISSTLSNLVELDITGCSVTLEDVKHFKSQRPNVKTYSSFSTRHEMYE
ncbi:uncharacterized protein LOC109861276 isoform X1 [Pseudomyrmex gracilis]|uniref:uncharacterized protein LOC109861276 isoform X1 n=1 Tax=Pseudomyrmex gracilis TaxID=219809 RepID=UPI000995CEE2|nr:uncharacterized protein LOC109861276 isoform X1 [Pseudomyrmex gracilis]